MNADQRLDRLEQAISTLRVEFEKFFNGAAEVPPDDLRDEVRGEIRELRNANLRAAVHNFRLAQLEARFNSFSELFNRRLRRAEEGRLPSAPPRQRVFDPQRGVVVEGRLEADVVAGLYAGLADAGRRPKFDLDTFRGYLEKQMRAIRQRTGRRRVRFRVENDDGRLKLKAKPLAE